MNKQQQPNQVKNNTGRLFTNSYKKNDNQPDFKGSGLVNGVEVSLSAWSNTDKNGNSYFSIQFEDMALVNARKSQAQQQGQGGYQQPQQQAQYQQPQQQYNQAPQKPIQTNNQPNPRTYLQEQAQQAQQQRAAHPQQQVNEHGFAPPNFDN